MSTLLPLLGRLHGRTVHTRRVRILAGWFVRMIPAGHRVLDVGCGDGLIDALIIAQRPDLEIRGADVLERPQSHIPVHRFDGKQLPFGDRSFDTVIVCDVLHHTDSPLESLREIARVARSNVLIKDHLAQGLLSRPTLRFMDLVGNAPHGVVLPYNYLSLQTWRDCFAECGLNVEELHTELGLYPRWANWVFGRGLHLVARLSRGEQRSTQATVVAR